MENMTTEISYVSLSKWLGCYMTSMSLVGKLVDG